LFINLGGVAVRWAIETASLKATVDPSI
jgi:hypothetical protein